VLLESSIIGRSGLLNVPMGTGNGAGFWLEIQSEIQSESGLIRLNPTKKIVREEASFRQFSDRGRRIEGGRLRITRFKNVFATSRDFGQEPCDD